MTRCTPSAPCHTGSCPFCDPTGHITDPAPEPARKVRLTPAAAIKPRRVRWLWDNRIPVGEITLVAGREGAGKSTFLAWMVRAVTRGELPGEYEGQPRAVLYAAAEDSWAYTVVPRLIAAGADLNHVYRVDVEDVEHGKAKLTLPADTSDVLAAGRAVNATVLMLDPGLSFLDDRIDTFRTPEVRPALETLRRHAERHGIAVIMLCHFNKSTGTDVLTKIAGSRAFAEVARAALAVAVDDRETDEDDDTPPDDERTVILSQAKNNLGRMSLPNLTYVIRDAIVETEDGDAHVGRLHWTGESQRTAEQALNGHGRPAGKNQPLSGLAAKIFEWIQGEKRAVPTGEITDQFRPVAGASTVRTVLARMAERGQLSRPAWGHYATTPAVSTSRIGAETTETSETTPGQHTSSSSGGGETTETGDLEKSQLSQLSHLSQGSQDNLWDGYEDAPEPPEGEP